MTAPQSAAGPVEPPTPRTVPVLYHDAALLVLDKPAGLPVHPSSRYLHGTVVGRLRQRFGARYAAPVHRLDRETSGLLICARGRAAARALSRSLGARAWQKIYLALCEGHMAVPRMMVEAPLAVGGAIIRLGVRVDVAQGRPATTELLRLATWTTPMGELTLVQARPHTGRRHQIRAHLRHVGLPLVGDKIYGASEHLYERFIAGALTAADRSTLQLERQALHAWRLCLPHPTAGFDLQLQAPIPADMLRLFDAAARRAVQQVDPQDGP